MHMHQFCTSVMLYDQLAYGHMLVCLDNWGNLIKLKIEVL